MQAARRLFLIDGKEEEPVIQCIGGWCIEIKNRVLDQHVIDNDIIFAGDRSGSSSPLPGLGASLSFTAYPSAIVKFLESEDRQSAGESYQKFCNQIVEKWQNKARNIKLSI